MAIENSAYPNFRCTLYTLSGVYTHLVHPLVTGMVLCISISIKLYFNNGKLNKLAVPLRVNFPKEEPEDPGNGL